MLPYKGKLAIFTSFNSYHAYAPYVISLAQTLGVLSKLGVEWDYLARPADFHVERAINNTLTEIMERDDFTDILLIDSDESWEPEGVIRLLLHPEEQRRIVALRRDLLDQDPAEAMVEIVTKMAKHKTNAELLMRTSVD